MKTGWIAALVALLILVMIALSGRRNRYDMEAAWCRREYWGASTAADTARVDQQLVPGGAQTMPCVSLRKAGRTEEPEPDVVGPSRLRDEGDDARSLVQQLMHAVAARDSAQVRSLVISDAVAAKYLRTSADSATWERFASAQWHLIEISAKPPDTLFPWYAARAAQLGCSRRNDPEFRIGLLLVRHPPTWRVGSMYPELGPC
jgi:hypothetical protein